MSREEEDNDEGTKDICVFFLVAWFIAGNVWVFRNYSRFDLYLVVLIIMHVTMLSSFWFLVLFSGLLVCRYATMYIYNLFQISMCMYT